MKKKSFIFVLLVSLVLLSGCSAGGSTANEKDSNKEEEKVVTVDTVAIEKDAIVGKVFDSSNPSEAISYTIPSGGGFTVMSVTKHDDLKIGENNFKNCIDFQVYGTVENIKNFASKDAYFAVIDSEGKENTNLSTKVGANGENTSIIIESEDPLTAAKYLIIGGLEPDKNEGSSKLIFEIKWLKLVLRDCFEYWKVII